MPSISKAWQFCVDVCNDPNVGYSMNTTLRRLYHTGSGGKYYCDCSSLMCYSVLAGGFTMNGYNEDSSPFSTGEEIAALESAGFVNIGIPSELRKGDIGHVYASERGMNSGHTEMVYEGGGVGTARLMGAHTSNTTWADQVCIDSSTWNGSSFKRFFRYEGVDDETGKDNPTSRKEINACVVAAIAGNMYQESGINPGLWEYSATQKTWDAYKEGYGLGQWTNTEYPTTNGRLYKLAQWLAGNNYSYDSGSGQCAYLPIEATWQRYYWWQSQFDFQSLNDFLLSDSTDIETLTLAYCYCWEGISEYNVDWDFGKQIRINKAKEFYDYFQEHSTDEASMWYAKDSALSESQINNNALMLFKCLNNYTMAQSSTAGDSGNTTPGDSGTPQPNEVSFEDFLMSMLGNKGEKRSSIHIKSNRRQK